MNYLYSLGDLEINCAWYLQAAFSWKKDEEILLLTSLPLKSLTSSKEKKI